MRVAPTKLAPALVVVVIAVLVPSCARRAIGDDVAATDSADTASDCDTPFVARDVSAPSTNAGAICSSSGWCWEDPLPHGDTITSFWASSRTDGYAITNAGELLHWDGSTWRGMQPPPDFVPTSVNGVAADSVWFAGSSSTRALRAAKWNGSSWSGVVTLDGRGDGARVWCAAADDVWIASDRIVHLSGSTWVDAAPSDLIMGARLFHAGDALFAIDSVSAVQRWDGTSWQAMPPPRVDFDGGVFAPASLGGTGASDVWAFDGSSNVSRHWDGTQWSAPAMEPPVAFFVADIMASADAALWLLGWDAADVNHPSLWRRDTGAWTSVETPSIGWARLAATRTDALWLYGMRGAIAAREGSAWTTISGASPLASGATWFAIDGTAETDLWVVGSASGPNNSSIARIAHRDATGWHDAWSGEGFLRTVSANAPNDVWAAGGVQTSSDSSTGLVVHWDGGSWRRVDIPIQPAPWNWAQISSTGPRDVWIAGNTVLVHFDGTTWSRVDLDLPDPLYPRQYWAVSAYAPDDVWLVDGHASWTSGNSFASHWDGARWRTEPLGDVRAPQTGYPGFTVVRGRGDETWVVGDSSARWHRVSGTWVREEGFGNAAWEGCESDVWFANEQTVTHRATNGESTEMTTAAATPVVSGWTSSTGNSWVTIANGGIMRRDAR